MNYPFIPRIAAHGSQRERLAFLIVSLCGFYDDAISILSLGFLATNARAHALFTWFDDSL